jgi:hypothetical protein
MLKRIDLFICFKYNSFLLGFDRLESSSPTSDWNKPVTHNSTANGWSSFQQQQQNPSRSNSNKNQWPEMNNIYGSNTPTNSFNLSQQNNDNNRYEEKKRIYSLSNKNFYLLVHRHGKILHPAVHLTRLH